MSRLRKIYKGEENWEVLYNQQDEILNTHGKSKNNQGEANAASHATNKTFREDVNNPNKGFSLSAIFGLRQDYSSFKIKTADGKRIRKDAYKIFMNLENPRNLISLLTPSDPTQSFNFEASGGEPFTVENEYEQKAKQLALNLDSNSYIKNKNLRVKVLSGEIDPSKLVHFTPQELFPEKWSETIMANQELLKKQVEGSKARATTDMFTCPKCKKKETTYYEQQTRGADELMT